MAYDPDNVFARILRGELPCNKVRETEHSLAFHDINPQAPVHVLVIPKGAYVSFHDFADQASPAEMTDFFGLLRAVAAELDLAEQGYRLLANAGPDAHQEVPHFHMHLFAGRDLGPMLAKTG